MQVRAVRRRSRSAIRRRARRRRRGSPAAGARARPARRGQVRVVRDLDDGAAAGGEVLADPRACRPRRWSGRCTARRPRRWRARRSRASTASPGSCSPGRPPSTVGAPTMIRLSARLSVPAIAGCRSPVPESVMMMLKKRSSRAQTPLVLVAAEGRRRRPGPARTRAPAAGRPGWCSARPRSSSRSGPGRAELAHGHRGLAGEPVGQGAGVRVGVQRDHPVAAVLGQHQPEQGGHRGLADAALHRGDGDVVGLQQRAADPVQQRRAGARSAGPGPGVDAPPRQPQHGPAPARRRLVAPASRRMARRSARRGRSRTPPPVPSGGGAVGPGPSTGRTPSPVDCTSLGIARWSTGLLVAAGPRRCPSRWPYRSHHVSGSGSTPASIHGGERTATGPSARPSAGDCRRPVVTSGAGPVSRSGPSRCRTGRSGRPRPALPARRPTAGCGRG